MNRRSIDTVLVYERDVHHGGPVAAVAWCGEDVAICLRTDAPSSVHARIVDRIQPPISQSVAALVEMGYATKPKKIRATSTTEAARMALEEAGLEDV